MPHIPVDLTLDLDWALPHHEVSGYSYSEARQPYHLEVWVEKSTMDDVLIPICSRFGVNLVTGLGFMSITSVIELLQRVAQADKPGRIFYISDFDPAGDGMPTAVARQIEFWLDTCGHELDIKLNPIALTQDQVQQYRLPRIPVKDSDRRKASFEERYGQGAVELDALEALHPGELARLVQEQILQFRDAELADKLEQAREEAHEELATAWHEWIQPYRGRLDDLQERIGAIVERYQGQLRELSGAMDGELEPYREELNSLRQAIQGELDELEVDLPELPEPQADPQEDGWLFDSHRDYFEQLVVYKARKGGEP